MHFTLQIFTNFHNLHLTYAKGMALQPTRGLSQDSVSYMAKWSVLVVFFSSPLKSGFVYNEMILTTTPTKKYFALIEPKSMESVEQAEVCRRATTFLKFQKNVHKHTQQMPQRLSYIFIVHQPKWFDILNGFSISLARLDHSHVFSLKSVSKYPKHAGVQPT